MCVWVCVNSREVMATASKTHIIDANHGSIPSIGKPFSIANMERDQTEQKIKSEKRKDDKEPSDVSLLMFFPT